MLLFPPRPKTAPDKPLGFTRWILSFFFSLPLKKIYRIKIMAANFYFFQIFSLSGVQRVS